MADQLQNKIAVREETDSDVARDKDPVAALASASGDELSLQVLEGFVGAGICSRFCNPACRYCGSGT